MQNAHTFEVHPLRSYIAKNTRRILLVFPRYTPSFGTFNHAFGFFPGVGAFMPPQGILLIGALLPREWEVRFVDENIRRASAEELEWADAVFISGMHIQRGRIEEINERAHEVGKTTVLGGPSVSAAPEFYPDVDILHRGEAGDGTLGLFEYLDKRVERPERQVIFRTKERLGMREFPSPAYQLTNIQNYLLGSVQFSSGCPFQCEFCDIPGLYGRNPRYKTAGQILDELEQLKAGGADAIYFVDDNFIANPKAALEVLPALAAWQKKHDYSVRLSCEATLNIATHPKILELMREAFFTTVFCGIETPEPAALRAMKKNQNLRAPMLESIEVLNRYGMEVASGIILGLDTDTADTGQSILDFAEASQIPIMTVNILYALPHTPLFDRMQKAGRLISDEGRDSNIRFLEPYEVVIERWQKVVRAIYQPEAIYRRFATQSRKVYVNRKSTTHCWRQLTWRNIKRAVQIFSKIIWNVGIRSDYRKEFWKMFRRELREGNIETIFHVAPVAHHLITYARECTRGRMQSSNYSRRAIEDEEVYSASASFELASRK